MNWKRKYLRYLLDIFSSLSRLSHLTHQQPVARQQVTSTMGRDLQSMQQVRKRETKRATTHCKLKRACDVLL